MKRKLDVKDYAYTIHMLGPYTCILGPYTHTHTRSMHTLGPYTYTHKPPGCGIVP